MSVYPTEGAREMLLPARTGPVSYPLQGRLCRPDSRDLPIHGRQSRPYQVAECKTLIGPARPQRRPQECRPRIVRAQRQREGDRHIVPGTILGNQPTGRCDSLECAGKMSKSPPRLWPDASGVSKTVYFAPPYRYGFSDGSLYILNCRYTFSRFLPAKMSSISSCSEFDRS